MTPFECATVLLGKGRHRAKLNIGDSVAYGLAPSRDQPLMFKGQDLGPTAVKRLFE